MVALRFRMRVVCPVQGRALRRDVRGSLRVVRARCARERPAAGAGAEVVLGLHLGLPCGFKIDARLLDLGRRGFLGRRLGGDAALQVRVTRRGGSRPSGAKLVELSVGGAERLPAVVLVPVGHGARGPAVVAAVDRSRREAHAGERTLELAYVRSPAVRADVPVGGLGAAEDEDRAPRHRHRDRALADAGPAPRAVSNDCRLRCRACSASCWTSPARRAAGSHSAPCRARSPRCRAPPLHGHCDREGLCAAVSAAIVGRSHLTSGHPCPHREDECSPEADCDRSPAPCDVHAHPRRMTPRWTAQAVG